MEMTGKTLHSQGLREPQEDQDGWGTPRRKESTQSFSIKAGFSLEWTDFTLGTMFSWPSFKTLFFFVFFCERKLSWKWLFYKVNAPIDAKRAEMNSHSTTKGLYGQSQQTCMRWASTLAPSNRFFVRLLIISGVLKTPNLWLNVNMWWFHVCHRHGSTLTRSYQSCSALVLSKSGIFWITEWQQLPLKCSFSCPLLWVLFPQTSQRGGPLGVAFRSRSPHCRSCHDATWACTF